jgi:hypothetical protein
MSSLIIIIANAQFVCSQTRFSNNYQSRFWLASGCKGSLVVLNNIKEKAEENLRVVRHAMSKVGAGSASRMSVVPLPELNLAVD